MKLRIQLAVIITLAVVIDLIARFVVIFDFARVMHAEVILFTVTTGALILIFRRETGHDATKSHWRALLVGFFALGDLRCILWSSGVPLAFANFGTLVVLIVAILVWVIVRRRRNVKSKVARNQATARPNLLKMKKSSSAGFCKINNFADYALYIVIFVI
jgi:hypothetical protein